MAQWLPASQVPGLTAGIAPAAPPGPPDSPGFPAPSLAPHRGTMILIFGILGLACCVLFGVASWVMGSRDLAEMEAGRMDSTGRGMTQAGKICGIVSVVLTIVGIAIWLISIFWFSSAHVSMPHHRFGY